MCQWLGRQVSPEVDMVCACEIEPGKTAKYCGMMLVGVVSMKSSLQRDTSAWEAMSIWRRLAAMSWIGDRRHLRAELPGGSM
jgi:hypothetical protein